MAMPALVLRTSGGSAPSCGKNNLQSATDFASASNCLADSFGNKPIKAIVSASFCKSGGKLASKLVWAD